MARKQYFEYAVLYHPKPITINESRVVPDSVEVVKPTRVLAANEKEVQILIGRALPETYLDKLEDVEILVRPF